MGAGVGGEGAERQGVERVHACKMQIISYRKPLHLALSLARGFVSSRRVSSSIKMSFFIFILDLLSLSACAAGDRQALAIRQSLVADSVPRQARDTHKYVCLYNPH